LRRLVAGAIGAVARGEKLQQRVRLIESDQLGLTRGANQLLPAERGIADQRLKCGLGAYPEIDDVGGKIFC
jgi:hypothetical protein